MARGNHPWPTDGVTRRQLDKEVDKLRRLYFHSKERRKALEERVERLEKTIYGELPRFRDKQG